MAERSREPWPDVTREPASVQKPEPSPVVGPQPSREAMSFIRALANDWEDTRSHAEAAKHSVHH